MSETYYIGSQDEVTKIHESNFFYSNVMFPEWGVFQGSVPVYPEDDDGIYKIVVEMDEGVNEIFNRTIDFNNISEVIGEIVNKEELVDHQKLNMIKEMLNPSGSVLEKIKISKDSSYIIRNDDDMKRIFGPTASFPSDKKDNSKYFYDSENKIILELDLRGKVIDTTNLYDMIILSQNVFAVNIDGQVLDTDNARILKIPNNDSYIYLLYFGLNTPIFHTDGGVTLLRSMLNQIRDVENLQTDDYIASEDILRLFNEIDNEHKEKAIDIEDFWERKINLNEIATKELVQPF